MAILDLPTTYQTFKIHLKILGFIYKINLFENSDDLILSRFTIIVDRGGGGGEIYKKNKKKRR